MFIGKPIAVPTCRQSLIKIIVFYKHSIVCLYFIICVGKRLHITNVSRTSMARTGFGL